MGLGLKRNITSRMLSRIVFGFILAGFALYFSPVLAENNAKEIAKKMDQAMTRAKDQFFEYDMVIQKPGQEERSLIFQVTIKGRNKRRLNFLEPGDVKGMKFLVLSTTQMYIYLPAYRKVRRVASHVRDQGFMGSAYSQEDMAIVTYGDYMEPKLISDDKDTWTLEMTRRKGKEKDFPYPKLQITLDKKMYQPVKIEYFNDDGKIIKTETRTDFECKGNICNPKVMKMVDHRRNDVVTYLKRRKWKLNTGIKDSYFTVRSLQRRR